MISTRNVVTILVCYFAIFIVYTTSYSDLCIQDCQCIRNAQHAIVIVNCSNTSLSEVPKDFPNTVISLILSANLIEKLDIASFINLTHLKLLDLSENKISNLPKDVFNGLFSLEKLSLRQNQIIINNISVPDDVFKDLKKLKVLNLQNNCDPVQTGAFYPDQAFSELLSLEELHIDGLLSKPFGPGFKKLRLLALLNLTGIDGAGRCGIEEITENFFTNFGQNLNYLDVTHCEIRYIHPLSFSKMTGLETLDFSNNHHMGIQGVENVSRSLTFIPAKQLLLSYIYRTDHDHVDLRQKSFRFFHNTSLISLDLSSNSIEYIEPEVIDCLPRSLQFLSLRDNLVQDAHFLERLIKLENLRTIDMSYQFRFHSRLNASKQENIKTSFFRLSHNTSAVLFDEDTPVPLPPNLEYAYGSNMKLGYPVPPLKFTRNKIKVLDISKNSLPVWLGPWYGLDSLQIFNLSYNGLLKIVPNSFVDMQNLIVLLLAGNRLGSTLYDDKQYLTFSNQTLLEVLDLSLNEIKILPKYLFMNLHSLKVLNLQNNSLVNIDFQLNQMKRIEILDLSYNQLTDLSEGTCKELDFIARSHDVSVNLTGNPLRCSCENLIFLQWMQSHKTMLNKLEGLDCLHEGEIVSLSTLDTIIENLQNECIGKIVVQVCAIGFVGLLLLILIPTVIYHKRWKLRYLYNIGPRKTNPYHQIERQHINYHAYISFPESLRPFVVNRLYPELTRRGLTLTCVEDIESGTTQSKAVTELIQRCDKTVVLLADDYFTDFWTIFEFHMAIQEGIYTRRETVIPVVFGPIRSCNAHTEIMAYFKSNKCISYPGEEHENAFWEYIEMRIKQ